MGLSQGGPFFLLFGVAALLLGGSSGSSSHSLRYFFTSVSEPGQQVPQFYHVAYLDDQEFAHYNASTKRYLPTVPWIREVVKDDPRYWEQESQRSQNAEQVFRVGLGIAAGYYNQSGGAHSWQLMYGCELRRDGSKGGYWQYAYDGRDFLSFDKETLTWTAADVPAQNTKRKWEAQWAHVRYAKAYLEEECIEWLQRYLEYGQEMLLRTGRSLDASADSMGIRSHKVCLAFLKLEHSSGWKLVKPYAYSHVIFAEVPDVKVTRKVNYDGMETLICHVEGFYPKDIDIDWKRDGEVWLQDTYHGLVSPNSDGTYYTWRSITVDPKERERYKCHVEHDGLPNPVDMAWEEPASNLWLIIGCVLRFLLLIVALAGIAVYFKKRQDGYKKAAASDQGSNSSGTGTAVPI